MSKLQCIFELTTEEAYQIVEGRFGTDLPPLDAVENEDWGRDYILQKLRDLSTEELAGMGLTWDKAADD